MIDLPNVDLIIIDCIREHDALEILEHCSNMINFGGLKLFTDKKVKCNFADIIQIETIDTIQKYSDFCLKLNNYIDNDFVLTIQRDGFILNPNLWDNNYLCFDYIGAPWRNFGQYSNDIGNGGFSLRSKYFLEYSASFKSTNGLPEDYFLNEINFDKAKKFDINYPDLNIALKFSVENFVPKVKNKLNLHNSFGFHGRHLIETLKMQKPELTQLLDRIN